MSRFQSSAKKLSNLLMDRQLACDRVSFFVDDKVFEELSPLDVAKHNCLHLINLLSKFDIATLEKSSQKILQTEVVPDLLVYAFQLAHVFNHDPIENLLKEHGIVIDETIQITNLNELRDKILENKNTTLKVENLQKTIIQAASYLARICDKNDHGTIMSTNEVSTNVTVPLLMASIELSDLLKVDLYTAYKKRIEQIMAKYGNVRNLLDKRANSFEWCGPAKLPREDGEWKLYGFKDIIFGKTVEGIALVLGEVEKQENVLIRLHSQCITSEVFRSLKCDCKDQLDTAVELIVEKGQGVIVYVLEEGRGIGIYNKVAAYAEQDTGKDTIEANISIGQPVEGRTFKLEGKILRHLNPKSIILITNNPDKIKAVEKIGVAIKKIFETRTPSGPHSRGYIHTKREKFGHGI